MRMIEGKPVAEPIGYTGPIPTFFKCPICGEVLYVKPSDRNMKEPTCSNCGNEVVIVHKY